MAPEERLDRIERQLEFLADQTAQLFSLTQEHHRMIELHSEQIARNSEQIAQLVGQTGQLTDLLLRTGRIVEAMAQQSDDRFARLDDRLNVLIGVVERIVSDGKR